MVLNVLYRFLLIAWRSQMDKRNTGRFISPDPLSYFWSNIKKNDVSGCWNWKGCKFNTGYGYFKNSHLGTMPASRAAWLLLKGPIESGMFVCHTCDNRRCCNPDHLFIGTQKENMKDCVDKGRINRGEDRPQSKLTEAIVREARQLRQQGYSWEALRDRFLVGKSCIFKAVMGETWSFVDEPIPTIKIGPGRRKQ